MYLQGHYMDKIIKINIVFSKIGKTKYLLNYLHQFSKYFVLHLRAFRILYFSKCSKSSSDCWQMRKFKYLEV